jgi:ribosome modulation factor
MSKDKYEEMADFNRGYQDGKSGTYKDYSVMEKIVGALVPGVDPAENSKAYDKGYEAGKKDKNR